MRWLKYMNVHRSFLWPDTCAFSSAHLETVCTRCAITTFMTVLPANNTAAYLCIVDFPALTIRGTVYFCFAAATSMARHLTAV